MNAIWNFTSNNSDQIFKGGQPGQSLTIETAQVSETLEFDLKLTCSTEMPKSGVELMIDHLWPVWLDRISYYCLVNVKIFEKQKCIWYEMSFDLLYYNFYLKYFSTEEQLAK